MRRLFIVLGFVLVFGGLVMTTTVVSASELEERVLPLVRSHEGQTGVYVLEKGEEALLSRAWLADHATTSINVQYFIWSSDNIGTLAAENLLRAAERGVVVRVLVDDLMVDAPDQFLLALAAHPKVAIKIYNPQHKVGVSTPQRVLNIFSDFRASNQRMHDKTFVVDDMVAITGGRNMAAEYFDYNQIYNFRDRDVLLIGAAAGDINSSFEHFWNSDYAQPVETLLGDSETPDAEQISQACADLHRYAADETNFAPEVRRALADLSGQFAYLIEHLVWGDVTFISDRPGKNSGQQGLGGGGLTTAALAAALGQARKQVTIQSPYLVLPEGGLELFAALVQRGVKVRIITNSLLSTDNLQAFSGYSKQRKELLAAGIDIYEFKPAPAVQKNLIDRYAELEKQAPIFAIHAKTLVIDSEKLFIGTFNLDPRSANLNTEVGIIISNQQLASQVEQVIEVDMQPENSWLSREDNPDRFAPLGKRMKLLFWKLFPMEKIL